jgi:outer membrane protein OmpA-like peptidoglycan-associated protein
MQWLRTSHIPVRHIVVPPAMGVDDPATSNEDSNGRAENRRVEVKLLVDNRLSGH